MSLLHLRRRQAATAAAAEALARAVDEVETVMAARHLLTAVSADPAHDPGPYLAPLADRLSPAADLVRIACQLTAVAIAQRHLLPLLLLAHEALANAVLHAFADGMAGRLVVTLDHGAAGAPRLRVADNGIGLPADLEFPAQGRCAALLLRALAQQCGAVLAVTRGVGTTATVELPPAAGGGTSARPLLGSVLPIRAGDLDPCSQPAPGVGRRCRATDMRPTTATIDLAALRHNLARVRALAPRSRVVAVVKANGYGHGAARLLPALAAADMLGVACAEEALTLRAAGARQPILLMEGVFDPVELPACAAEGFEVAVHHVEQVRMLEGVGLTRPIVVWLKIDTGMHRLGVAPAEARTLHARLAACQSVAGIRLMTHFASADLPDPTPTAAQLARFAALDLPGERSLANSAAVLAWTETHADWIRPGIMLFGVSPMHGQSGVAHGLRPVMTLATRVIAVRDVPAGDTVGYGGVWAAPRPTRVGTAAIGYGDGYPRHAPSGTPVLVNGREVPLIGRVSMDMITLDLTDQPAAAIGDPVILWGAGLPAERIAEAAGTIAYELLCGVTGRVHVRVVGA